MSDKLTVRLNVDLYYEFDRSEFPAFMTEAAVAAACRERLEDFGAVNTLEQLAAILERAPVDVDVAKEFTHT